MAEALIEEYNQSAEGTETTSAQLHASLQEYKPAWESYPATQANAALLNVLYGYKDATIKKAVLVSEPGYIKASLSALSVPDDKPVQWVLTLLYDMLREDSSCFSIFEQALKQPIGFHSTLVSVLQRAKVDQYIADKAAWILSAVIGNVPGAFTNGEVVQVVTALQRPGTQCSEVGILDALVNMMKSDSFRKLVWQSPGVAPRITSIPPQSPPPVLYKSIFAIWLLSFEPAGVIDLQGEGVIKNIKDALASSRVEKVVRMSLTALRNLINQKKIAEEVVESGVLECVQQVEFEKWRDAELYDDIRDMIMLISAKVQEMSNFDRYERELNEGKLKWGFIHSSKFWADNVLKFEQNDFRALRLLAGMLSSHDSTTLAVACHDLGEFVTMHPLGKKQIAGLGVKESVMKLMSTTDPTQKEVRREALLCCQKIMLNKWQDVEA